MLELNKEKKTTLEKFIRIFFYFDSNGWDRISALFGKSICILHKFGVNAKYLLRVICCSKMGSKNCWRSKLKRLLCNHPGKFVVHP